MEEIREERDREGESLDNPLDDSSENLGDIGSESADEVPKSLDEITDEAIGNSSDLGQSKSREVSESLDRITDEAIGNLGDFDQSKSREVSESLDQITDDAINYQGSEKAPESGDIPSKIPQSETTPESGELSEPKAMPEPGEIPRPQVIPEPKGVPTENFVPKPIYKPKEKKSPFSIPKPNLPLLDPKIPQLHNALRELFKGLFKGKEVPDRTLQQIGELRVKVGDLARWLDARANLPAQELCRIFGENSARFQGIMNNEQGVKLKSILQVPADPSIQQQLSPEDLSTLQHIIKTSLNNYVNSGKNVPETNILDDTLRIEHPTTSEKNLENKELPPENQQSDILDDRIRITTPLKKKENNQGLMHSNLVTSPHEDLQSVNQDMEHKIELPDSKKVLRDVKPGKNNRIQTILAEETKMIDEQPTLQASIDTPRQDFLLDDRIHLQAPLEKKDPEMKQTNIVANTKIDKGTLSTFPVSMEYIALENESMNLEELFKKNPLLQAWWGSQLQEFRKDVLKQDKKNDFIKVGYGKWVPQEIINDGKLSDVLLKTGWFKKYSLKNPELGQFLERLKGKLRLKQHEFSKLLGTASNTYRKIIKGGRGLGVKIQKLLELPEQIKNNLSHTEIELLKREIESLLTHKNTTIMARQNKLNFHPENLERIHIGNHDYVILPTSKWHIAGKRDSIKRWTRNYYYLTHIFNTHAQSPKTWDLNSQFPGFLGEEKKYGRTINDFLSECGVSLNLKKEFDWSDSNNREVAKGWIKNFYYLTYVFDKIARSPTAPELDAQYPGFRKYRWRTGKGTFNDLLKECGVPLNHEMKYEWTGFKNRELVKTWTKNFYYLTYVFDKIPRSPFAKELESKYPGILKCRKEAGEGTFNDLLRECGLPINRDVKYDWSDPQVWEFAKLWVRNFYYLTSIFDEVGRSPTNRQLNAQFPGMPYVSHNTFLKECNVPLNERDQCIKEGIEFDEIGKDLLNFLVEEAIVEPRIFHPKFNEIGRTYAKPDAIIHDFHKNPLEIKGNKIYLKEGEKIDSLIEFKRNYKSIRSKDWNEYTLISKKMEIFLLRGNSGKYLKNNCVISCHSRNELLKILKTGFKNNNKKKIKKLIRRIHVLIRGIDYKSQKTIQEY